MMEIFFAKTDQIFDLLAKQSPLLIYALVFLSMFVENVFPPFPGDTVMFIGAVYAAGGHVSWTALYFVGLIGSLASVMSLYYVGRTQGRRAFQSHWLRWLGVDRVGRVERLYARWGNKLLLISRWLVGVRALVVLFAGVGHVRPWKMFLYSTISAASFNLVIMYLAVILRRDWQKIDRIFGIYNLAVLIIVLLIVLLVYISIRRKRRTEPQ